MITITQAMLEASNKRIKKIWQRKASAEANAVLYAMGRKKAHYPVPAITYTFSVSERGRWALIKDWHLKVYRWWHKRTDGTYATNKGM